MLRPCVQHAVDSLEYIQENPEDSVTLKRAELWDFAHPTDLNITLARDWTLYGGMGSLMLDYGAGNDDYLTCLLYTSPSPRDRQKSRMPSSA